jgi:hypothetical protein
MWTRCAAAPLRHPRKPARSRSPRLLQRPQNRGAYGGQPPPGYDSRTARKAVQRRVVDYTATVARSLQARVGYAAACVLATRLADAPALPPLAPRPRSCAWRRATAGTSRRCSRRAGRRWMCAACARAAPLRGFWARLTPAPPSAPAPPTQLEPPAAYPNTPASSFTTKFAHVSTNKARGAQRGAQRPAPHTQRSPPSHRTGPRRRHRRLLDARGAPPADGLPDRRVHDVERRVAAARRREPTQPRSRVPNTPLPGTAFNYETILQAHDTAIRALVWSHNENWLISGARAASRAPRPPRPGLTLLPPSRQATTRAWSSTGSPT